MPALNTVAYLFTQIILYSQNEEYTMYRKGKDRAEYYEIESVKLSIAISGTPNQFRQLIYSPENGLFSRGTYYVFEPTEEKLKFTGRMNSEIDIEDKFASFAKIANDYYEQHLGFNEIQVIFSKEHLGRIEEVLQAIKDILGNNFDLEPNIKRAFLMAQKIATILMFLSECESGVMQGRLNCSEQSLNTAIQLTVIYMEHALRAYGLLPSKPPASLNDSQQRLLLVLPEEFTRGEGVQVGVENGLSQRAAYYAIEALEKKGLIKLQASGKYKKQ